MSQPASRTITQFVVLQHGSHGSARDLRYFNLLVKESNYIRSIVTHYTADKDPMHIFSPTVNEGKRTDDGVRECGERLAISIRDHILETIPDPLVNRQRVPLSLIGHSFGGLMLREAATYLTQDPDLLERVSMDTLCTLACPHVGVSSMHPVLRAGGRLIGRIKSKTYRELFLDNDDTLTTYMMDDNHINAMKAFRQRVFIGERSDKLVSLTSSTLFPSPSTGVELPTKRVCEEFPSVAHPAVLTPNRFMLIKDRTGSKTLTAEEQLAMRLLSKMESTGTHAYVVDFMQTAGRMRSQSLKIRAGVDFCSHRALVCKDPFYLPAAFGDVIRFVHDRVLGMRTSVQVKTEGQFL